LIYIEYISRRPGVDLADFHAAIAMGQEGWDAEYAEDQLILSVGRTWRLGPNPEYLGVWFTPVGEFERIDAWDRIFRDGHADVHENVFRRVATIDVAGCYRPLREPVVARGGTYYAEYFEPGPDSAATAAFFDERARRHPNFRLNILVERIGRLAPDPGGLAIWTVPTFASLSAIATDLDQGYAPVRLVTAGTYADVGREIL
jgi:hypothetical protein